MTNLHTLTTALIPLHVNTENLKKQLIITKKKNTFTHAGSEKVVPIKSKRKTDCIFLKKI